jgi:hypothetical protein
MVSVQLIEKVGRTNRLVETLGCSRDPIEIDRLVALGRDRIRRNQAQLAMDFNASEVRISQFLDSIHRIEPSGVEELVGKAFDQIGFNKLQDEMFRTLVIARVVRPTSKLGTVDYLRRELGKVVEPDSIYRYLDRLEDKLKYRVHDIAFKHTRAISGGRVGVVFYDVTTLYFEAERTDDFMIPGFSKDGKTQNPQIILGLLVDAQGTPLAYEIFKGNAFEGRTMIPVLEAFAKRFRLAKPIVVADAGLMSRSNNMELERLGYQYILGARIKNMDAQSATLALGLRRIDGKSEAFNLTDTKRLFVHYSAKRAMKDNHNRERGLMKLEKDVASGRLTKEHLTNRGYKKFLSLKRETKIKVDRSKIQEAQRWDRLKGYVMNTSLSKDEVMAAHRELLQIERSFRDTKSDLAARPIYHRLEHRIRAHICLCFAALKVHKELERSLKENGCPWSVHESIEIARTIKTLHGTIPETGKTIEYMMIKTEEQAERAGKMNFDVKNSLRNY